MQTEKCPPETGRKVSFGYGHVEMTEARKKYVRYRIPFSVPCASGKMEITGKDRGNYGSD